MKKVYEKPQMTYESFELSTSIAGSCRYGTMNAMPNICPIFDFALGKTLFALEGLCDEHVVPGQWDSPCYDNPSDLTNVFSS